MNPLRQLHKKLFTAKYEHILIWILRISIAVLFIWFGALKILGYNPVFDLVYHSLVPWFVTSTGLVVLGGVEIFIGAMLLTNRALLLTHALLILHLLGTFTTFIFGLDIVFDPSFPILSLDGEFVIKNMVLAIAGLVVLVHESRKRI